MRYIEKPDPIEVKCYYELPLEEPEVKDDPMQIFPKKIGFTCTIDHKINDIVIINDKKYRITKIRDDYYYKFPNSYWYIDKVKIATIVSNILDITPLDKNLPEMPDIDEFDNIEKNPKVEIKEKSNKVDNIRMLFEKRKLELVNK